MKLKDYKKQLDDLVKENPEILELDIVHSSDDEGNSFQLANFGPCMGNFEGDQFDAHAEIKSNTNAICIN